MNDPTDGRFWHGACKTHKSSVEPISSGPFLIVPVEIFCAQKYFASNWELRNGTFLGDENQVIFAKKLIQLK